MDKTNERCSCNQSLCIGRREAGVIASCGIMAFCITFVSGYFWGKKQTFESANQEIQKMVATHHLWQRLPQTPLPEMTAELPSESEITAQAELAAPDTTPATAEAALAQTDTHERWVAQLVGFGTRSAALAYQKQLQQRGNIETHLLQRTSAQRRKGTNKTVVWYQVVTNQYESETTLNQVIDNIQRIKPLNSIKKIKVNNGTTA